MGNEHSLTAAHISKLAFWDVNPAIVDIEEDSLFVMTKVFNYGTWEDIRSVFKYYGIRRIKKEVIHIPYLKKTAFSFLCLITGLKESDFKAIKRRQRREQAIWEK